MIELSSPSRKSDSSPKIGETVGDVVSISVIGWDVLVDGAGAPFGG